MLINFYYLKNYNMHFHECKLPVQQSLARLQTGFCDEIPGTTNIFSWFAEFKSSCVNPNDKFCEGQPSTAVNNKNITTVHHLIETDRYMTI